MEAEKQLPPTLLQQLNDDGELVTFNSWTRTVKNGSLAKVLPVEDPRNYEKQSAVFVKTLGAKYSGFLLPVRLVAMILTALGTLC